MNKPISPLKTNEDWLHPKECPCHLASILYLPVPISPHFFIKSPIISDSEISSWKNSLGKYCVTVKDLRLIVDNKPIWLSNYRIEDRVKVEIENELENFVPTSANTLSGNNKQHFGEQFLHSKIRLISFKQNYNKSVVLLLAKIYPILLPPFHL